MAYQDYMNSIGQSFNGLPSSVKPSVAAIRNHASEMQARRVQHVKAQRLEADPNRRATREQQYKQQRAADQARSAELLAQAQQAIASAEAQAAERESIMTPAMKQRAMSYGAFAKPLDVNALTGLLGSVDD